MHHFEHATRGAPLRSRDDGCLFLEGLSLISSREDRPRLRTQPRLHRSCGEVPDFRTISACRTRHLAACKDVFVQVVRDVTDAPNDTQQAEPMAQATRTTLAHAGIERPKDASGAVHAIPATLDNGSSSAVAVAALEAVGCDPSIATGRQQHHGPQAAVPETPATVQEHMAAKGQTPAGKA